MKPLKIIQIILCLSFSSLPSYGKPSCKGLKGVNLDDCRAGYLVKQETKVSYTYNCDGLNGVELDDCLQAPPIEIINKRVKKDSCEGLNGVERDDCLAGIS